MGLIFRILGSMFSSGDRDSGSDGRSPDRSITYVFFNNLSILDQKYRFYLRILLCFILGYCLWGLWGFLRYQGGRGDNPSNTHPLFLSGSFFLLAIPAIISYLFLVYIDSRRWSLVHPAISWGVSRLRLNKGFKIILIVFNICILIMVAIILLTGSLFSEFGMAFMAISGFIWFSINYHVIIRLFGRFNE